MTSETRYRSEVNFSRPFAAGAALLFVATSAAACGYIDVPGCVGGYGETYLVTRAADPDGPQPQLTGMFTLVITLDGVPFALTCEADPGAGGSCSPPMGAAQRVYGSIDPTRVTAGFLFSDRAQHPLRVAVALFRGPVSNGERLAHHVYEPDYDERSNGEGGTCETSIDDERFFTP